MGIGIRRQQKPGLLKTDVSKASASNTNPVSRFCGELVKLSTVCLMIDYSDFEYIAICAYVVGNQKVDKKTETPACS